MLAAGAPAEVAAGRLGRGVTLGYRSSEHEGEAMARKFTTTIKKPDPKIFKGWTFVLILGALLAVLALLHRGGVGAEQVVEPAAGAACQFEVTIDNLNVRTAPSQDGNAPVQTLTRGQRVAATPTIDNGYRELDGGLWTLDQHLAPVPGSSCG
ncbi:MAG: hypothetical protein ACT4RN_05705 [Pseudonocardia sp.]